VLAAASNLVCINGLPNTRTFTAQIYCLHLQWFHIFTHKRSIRTPVKYVSPVHVYGEKVYPALHVLSQVPGPLTLQALEQLDKQADIQQKTSRQLQPLKTSKRLTLSQRYTKTFRKQT